MTNTDKTVEAVARAIHEYLCKRNIMAYLDNDEDCEGIARAALASIPAPPPSPAGDVERLRVAAQAAVDFLNTAPLESGYCCCGSPVEWHGMGDGHSPVDELAYHASGIKERLLAALQPSPSPAGELDPPTLRETNPEMADARDAEERAYKQGEFGSSKPSPASNGAMPAAGMGEVDKPTVERCIHILRGSLLAGYGPDALAQRDSDIAVLEREILASTTSGERS